MDLSIETQDCNGQVIFKIDGLDAEYNMFGRMITEAYPWTCEEDQWTCDPCYFKSFTNPDGKTMDDYCLTLEDWNAICAKLEKELQWDYCSDCV
jgi:hypothetical protein